MKKIAILSLAFASLFGIWHVISAQEKPTKEEAKANPQQAVGPQLKVQIVFSEYDGEKKVKSLPYTVLVQVAPDWRRSKLRVGDRVPVATGGQSGGLQFQYIDVGTNIDCGAVLASEGRYQLQMSIERSWVEGNVAVGPGKSNASEKDETGEQFREPIIRQFKTENNVLLRDGQSVETTFATDPVSGKVIKLEVSLSVMK